ncbi:hypothetical protein PMAYCL1PPCAC_08324, partial [Pristionchus mayeri]
SQKCDFCDDPRLPCRQSPKDRTSAQRFFASIAAWNPEQQKKIEVLLMENRRALVCGRHIKNEPSDIFDPPAGDSRSNSQMNYGPGQKGMDRLQIPDVLQTKGKRRIRAEKCYLCDESSSDYLSTTQFNDCRKLFLASVITTTRSQRARIAKLTASGDHAYFCRGHISVKPQMWQSSGACQEGTALLTESVNCDFCDDPQLPCRQSPKDRTSA